MSMTFAVIGGSLIGLAAVWFMLSLGRIAGISGIVANAVTRPREAGWAVLFIVGIGIGGTLGAYLLDLPVVHDRSAVTLALVVGGFLVGVGTRIGSGCTSGHGVCGTARLSPRSIVATLTFLGVGMLTATLVYGA